MLLRSLVRIFRVFMSSSELQRMGVCRRRLIAAAAGLRAHDAHFEKESLRLDPFLDRLQLVGAERLAGMRQLDEDRLEIGEKRCDALIAVVLRTLAIDAVR